MIGAERPKADRKALAIAVLIGLAVLNSAATQYVASGSPITLLLAHLSSVMSIRPGSGCLAAQVWRPRPQRVQDRLGWHGPRSLSCGLFAFLALSGRNAERHEGIHGTAHWASQAEIEATGLLPKGEGAAKASMSAAGATPQRLFIICATMAPSMSPPSRRRARQRRRPCGADASLLAP